MPVIRQEGTYHTSAIRNPDGLFINSDVFREEAIHFMKNGYYTPDLPGTYAYMDYWTEQLRRCKEGYSVGGVRITGDHYGYLNFSQIQIVQELEGQEEGGVVGVKETKMPDFWDGDYNYFWCKDIARYGLKVLGIDKIEDLQLGVRIDPEHLDGGRHMIVGKSRRKGYSYKNGFICANRYNTIRKSLSIIGAFDKKYLYPKGTMAMASEYLSFFNKNTAWSKARDFVDKVDHRRASFEETQPNGTKAEVGYMSEIMAITFQNNPDAARGKDAVEVLFEEAGAFPNLKAAYKATRPSLEAGKFITGQITIFGTGGDMADGTAAFADMYYNPKEYRLMAFENIWDDNSENSRCGFFHPVYWNTEGYYDKQGNSDVPKALEAEKAKREELVKNSTSSATLQGHVQEYPLCPAEAFLMVSTNDFPVIELRKRYNKIMAEELHLKLGTPVHLFRQTVIDEVTKNKVSKVIAEPDMEGVLEPLWTYKPKTKNIHGCVVIYEAPMKNAPKGLYKIGYDPYLQAGVSDNGMPSLGGIYVYKGNHKYSYTRDTIVASFIGRPYDPDDVNGIAELLAEMYNAEVMYENNIPHTKKYFELRRKLHLLAAQPDSVLGKHVNNSGVHRVYGVHMNEKLKDAGEKYIKQWLLTIRDYDEVGTPIYNLDTLNDPALIEELILYNRDGNFDRVMAFMLVLIQLQEDEDKEYGKEENPIKEDLLNLLNQQFDNLNEFISNFD